MQEKRKVVKSFDDLCVSFNGKKEKVGWVWNILDMKGFNAIDNHDHIFNL